jgi:hypothetical protein
MSGETIPPVPNFPPGVQFNRPPDVMIPSIMGSIARAFDSLPPDVDGALVAIGTNKGANAAFVVRAPHGVDVVTWIGKSWGDGGELNYGVEVQKVFKWGSK